MTRTTFTTLIFLLVTLLVSPAIFAQDKYAAGQEGQFLLPGCKYPCVIYVPSDYKPGKRLPLIFFMHGSGGKPTSWPWKSATGGKGYFIVGLAYEPMTGGGQGRNGITLSPDKCREMIAFTNRVRDRVDAQYGIDQKNVFCTGLSMGGWAVDGYGICEECKGRYRAFCIIAAGPRQCGLFKPEVAMGLPVLILNGATDPNLAVANRGRPIMEKAGALVTQEIIPGQGHVPSITSMAPPLKKWLDRIAREDERAAALAAVKWNYAKLSGPFPQGKITLTDFLPSQDFFKNADKGKPILIYLTTRHKKKGKPSKQAQETAKLDGGTFSYPLACATPAAARHFTCFLIDVTAIDKKTNKLLNRETAPLVILVNRGRDIAVTLKKGRLRDQTLMGAMKPLVGMEQQAEIEARIATTKPILAKLKKIQKKTQTLQLALAKLKRKGSRKAISKKEHELATVTKEYEALREQLRGK